MNDADSSGLGALRALFEGAPATLGLLARAARRSEPALRRIAEAEGWSGVENGAEGADLERRLLVLSDRLMADLERASAEGERSGAYDKARIDALASMLRMVEKIGEKARGTERAREDQTTSDEDMAAALERIDARILDLAGDLARELAANRTGDPAGRAAEDGAAGLGAKQPAGAAVDGD